MITESMGKITQVLEEILASGDVIAVNAEKNAPALHNHISVHLAGPIEGLEFGVGVPYGKPSNGMQYYIHSAIIGDVQYFYLTHRKERK